MKMKKYMRKFMMLTLSLAMILSMAVFSSSAALRQTGSTTFTINGVSYACTGYFYTSGTSIYGGSKSDALTYRKYNYNSITYLSFLLIYWPMPTKIRMGSTKLSRKLQMGEIGSSTTRSNWAPASWSRSVRVGSSMGVV